MGLFKQHSLLNFTINVEANQCIFGYLYKIYIERGQRITDQFVSLLEI